VSFGTGIEEFWSEKDIFEQVVLETGKGVYP